jgi:hypothetical protein
MTMSDPLKSNPPAGRPLDADEPPPFWGTWRRIYVTIAVYVLVLVLALYWMTVALNR